MLERILVQLIEDRADELAHRLVEKVRADAWTAAYRDIDDEELLAAAVRVYGNLGRWVRAASEGDVEKEYFDLGRERREQGIPLSQVVHALQIVRQNLWQFVESRAADSFLELRQRLDLELLVLRFFDRAIHHTVRGYEADG